MTDQAPKPFLSTSRALSHLLEHAAHQLRNPLASLYTSLQVLQKRLNKEDENLKLLLAMEEEVERMHLQLVGLTQFMPPEDLIQECKLSLRQFIYEHPFFNTVSIQWKVEDLLLCFSEEEWMWVFSYLLSAIHKDDHTFILKVESKCLYFSQTEEDEGLLWDGKDYSFFTSPGRAFALQMIRSLSSTYQASLEVRKHQSGSLSFLLKFLH